jgi:uncharacterized protein DUF4304
MSRAALDMALRQIMLTTFAEVAKLGFVRRGLILRKIVEGNAAVIQFQRSVANTRDKILFTVNLGVVCGELIEPHEPPLERAGAFGAHLRDRVGKFLPGRPDKWWEITEGTDVDALATEVSSLVSSQGAPYILRYLDRNELIALWQSGQCPGLTDKERVSHLERLTKSLRGAQA